MIRPHITKEQAFTQISEIAQQYIENYIDANPEDATKRFFVEFDNKNIAWTVDQKMPIGTQYFGRVKLPESKEMRGNS